MAPKPWVVILFAVLALTALGVAMFVPIGRPQPTTPTNEDAHPQSYHDAPIFLLTERNGQEVTNADLDGKVWIASFIFTRCTMGCPQVTATMRQLQYDLNLDKTEGLRLVTFTVDPERDQLKDLNTYANSDKVTAHPTKWLFLTGKEKLVRPLLQRGFHVTAQKRPIPKPGDEFDHSTKLVLVDKFGRIRGLYDGLQGEHDTDGTRYKQSYENLKIMTGKLLAETTP